MSSRERQGKGQQHPNTCLHVQPSSFTGAAVTKLFLTVLEAVMSKIEASTDLGQRESSFWFLIAPHVFMHKRQGSPGDRSNICTHSYLWSEGQGEASFYEASATQRSHFQIPPV